MLTGAGAGRGAAGFAFGAAFFAAALRGAAFLAALRADLRADLRAGRFFVVDRRAPARLAFTDFFPLPRRAARRAFFFAAIAHTPALFGTMTRIGPQKLAHKVITLARVSQLPLYGERRADAAARVSRIALSGTARAELR
jgi:hypothetical protein